MNWKEISRVLGAYLFFFACAMGISFLVALYYDFVAEPSELPQASFAFLISLVICLCIAGGLRWLGRKAKGNLYRREGLIIVALIWFISAFVGAFPFVISGTLDDPLDAYFETISGLTTTGATIITAKEYDAAGEEVPIVHTTTEDPSVTYEFYGNVTPVRNAQGEVILKGIAALPKALLFWRSFLQWMGGMGIVVLFLAILPALGVGGKVLYQAEVPGPVKESMTPRIRSTASLLWKLYIVLTFIEVMLLLITNVEMTLFDACCISFSNISTGGFTVKNGSIAAYHNAATEWVVIAFMIIGSINFVHYTYIIKRKITRLWEPELIVYFCSIIAFSAIVVFAIVGTKEVLIFPTDAVDFSWHDAIRYGSFQLISLQTSTGFVTANYDHWPYVAQVVMLSAMFIGGMSGSTAGGVKIVRHTMLVRIVVQRIESIFRPNSIRAIRIGSAEVTHDRAMTVLSYFFIVISLTLIGTFLLVADGVDPQTSLTTIACMINNIGVAFREAGPTESFAFLSGFGKCLSILWMVMGRLEFFAILIIFLPDFWRTY